jgi:hypothetical protein
MRKMNIRSEFEQWIAKAGSGETYDVIVAGGGPAGLGAAMASAMRGAKTLLLEGRFFFGGVAQAALWMPMNWLKLHGGKRGGVHDVFVDTLESHGPEACRPGKTTLGNGGNLDIHPSYLQLGAFECLENTGCYYRLYSPVVDALMEGDKIVGVVTDGKGGRREFRSKIVIDATGDGDVAFQAGADMFVGGEDGRFMPASLLFTICNVRDAENVYERYWTGEGRKEFLMIMQEAFEKGAAMSPWYSLDKTTLPGVISVNNGGLKNPGIINGAEAEDLTLVERAGLQIAIDTVKALREAKYPGMEEAMLERIGFAAVRESRRIVGEYIMTMEDAIQGVEFEDVVARRYGAINPGWTSEHKPMVSGHAFPYRSLLPKRVENLLVAGRCASATQSGQSCGKSMGNMMDLGQACGVAAALAVKQDKTPRELDVKQIQNILVNMGSRIFK